MVLTGGGVGIATLAQLRDEPGEVDWRQLDIYWGDDRFVPGADPDRNELQARHALLDHVSVDPARVHAISASDGPQPDPADAAAAYAQLLPDRFDLHLLGMGPEGHVNSLFPHTDAVRETALSVVAVTDSPKPPPIRVTLTIPAIRRAHTVCLTVTGAAKADAVAAAIGGADPVDVPAAGAQGSAETVWLLDRSAAGRL